jgi:hypothetical protein
MPYSALDGEYVGASGDVGFGPGVGANVLIGGSNRGVALQPISLEGSAAVNVVAGRFTTQIAPRPALDDRV